MPSNTKNINEICQKRLTWQIVLAVSQLVIFWTPFVILAILNKDDLLDLLHNFSYKTVEKVIINSLAIRYVTIVMLVLSLIIWVTGIENAAWLFNKKKTLIFLLIFAIIFLVPFAHIISAIIAKATWEDIVPNDNDKNKNNNNKAKDNIEIKEIEEEIDLGYESIKNKYTVRRERVKKLFLSDEITSDEYEKQIKILKLEELQKYKELNK